MLDEAPLTADQVRPLVIPYLGLKPLSIHIWPLSVSQPKQRRPSAYLPPMLPQCSPSSPRFSLLWRQVRSFCALLFNVPRPSDLPSPLEVRPYLPPYPALFSRPI